MKNVLENTEIILFSLLIISITTPCLSLVPHVCVQNVTSKIKTCCPIPDGFNEPCGGKGRGVCEHVSVHREVSLVSALRNDDRINWPTRFFTNMCHCEGNFYGIACEKCWYGWEGEKCDKKRMVTRRNIFSFSSSEVEKFLKILEMSNKMPSEFLIMIENDADHSDPLRNPRFVEGTFQQFIAFIHRYASRSTLFKNELMCKHYGYLDNNHNTVAFATWHRALMLYWERNLAELADKMFNWKDFAIPYWDWVDNTECEPCRNNLMGSTGKYDEENDIWRLSEHSRFYNWTEYCSPPKSNSRCYGCHFNKNFVPLNRLYYSNKFPRTEDLIFTLRHSTWYVKDEKENQLKNCRSFHLALEGFCGRPDDDGDYLYMHNRIHNMVRGSMCCAATASNDPLFILHHSMIDRILDCWFHLHQPSPTQLPNHGVEIGNCRECFVVGHLPPVRHIQMFVPMSEFGIRYDNLKFGKQGFSCTDNKNVILKHKFD